jgi:hypothetical protein
MAFENHSAKALESAGDFLSQFLYKGVYSSISECAGGGIHRT